MSKVQIKQRYGKELKVVNYLGTNFLFEDSKKPKSRPKLDDLKGNELVLVLEKNGAKLFKAGKKFYLITGSCITEITGTNSIWIITGWLEKWGNFVGCVENRDSYVIALQESNKTISFYMITIQYGTAYVIHYMGNVPLDYFPPEDMYNSNDMPLGLKIIDGISIDTFWSLVKDSQTTQNGAFYINLSSMTEIIKLDKNDIVGEIYNPELILTKNGIFDSVNHEFMCHFGQKNERFLNEIDKYINVPCENGYCIALPKTTECISSSYYFRSKFWKTKEKENTVFGFVWNPKTMTKLYPIQEEQSNSKLYLYDNKLPHIVMTEDGKYHVYYWKEKTMMVAVSSKQPSILIHSDYKFIILKEENDNDLILQLTFDNELNSILQYDSIDYLIFVNKKNEKEIKPAYLNEVFYCGDYPLLIFIFKLKNCTKQYIEIMFYSKDAKFLSPVLLSNENEMSFNLLQYGYIRLCREQDGKMATTYCDWEKIELYYSEEELWNASVSKAKSIIEFK